MQVEMNVQAVIVDRGDRFIVLLREARDAAVLPIIVGQFEARAIDYELRRRQPSRPQTHDFLKNALTELGAVVRRVIVTELRDETYHAVIEVNRDGHTHKIDARPSDAIALALRCRCPIFAEQSVLDVAGLRPGGRPAEEGEGTGGDDEVADRFRSLIGCGVG